MSEKYLVYMMPETIAARSQSDVDMGGVVGLVGWGGCKKSALSRSVFKFVLFPHCPQCETSLTRFMLHTNTPFALMQIPGVSGVSHPALFIGDWGSEPLPDVDTKMTAVPVDGLGGLTLLQYADTPDYIQEYLAGLLRNSWVEIDDVCHLARNSRVQPSEM